MKESVSDEVIAYFEKNHGPVDPMGQIEIVPTTWPAISIHAIQPGEGRPYLTIFTTGMSDQAMTVPAGKEKYQYAEMFMQLPADWPFKQGEPIHPDALWLMQSMRNVAGVVHGDGNWLGEGFTIFAASEPPEPLAPHVKFTSLLLLAEKSFVTEDGRTIHLYQVSPLYTEERNLELTQGIAAFLRAFRKANVSFVVDLNRKSVVEHVPFFYVAWVWLGCGLFLLVPILLLLWIWIDGMGWASLGVMAAAVTLFVVLRLVTD